MNLRSPIVAIAALLLMAPQSGRASVPDPQAQVRELTGTVKRAIERFDAGDASGFAALFASDAIIVDSRAPFTWSGSGAAAKWMGDFQVYKAQAGITNFRLVAEPPATVLVAADRAYLLVPVKQSLVVRGRRASKLLDFTVTLQGTGGAWQIASLNVAEDVGFLYTGQTGTFPKE